MKKLESSKFDGCATYFRPEKFILVNKFEVHMGQNLSSELYCKPQVQLILVLQYVEFPSKLLIISNTHLYFNINRGDVKLAQLKITTDTMQQLKDYYEGVEKKQVSMVMCGDYNAAPRSGVYEYMRKGEYDCLKLSRNTISGQYHGTFSYDEKLSVQTL